MQSAKGWAALAAAVAVTLSAGCASFATAMSEAREQVEYERKLREQRRGLAQARREREKARERSEWERCAADKVDRNKRAVERGYMTTAKARGSTVWIIETSCGGNTREIERYVASRMR